MKTLTTKTTVVEADPIVFPRRIDETWLHGWFYLSKPDSDPVGPFATRMEALDAASTAKDRTA